ncbi:MAG: hypothetical protein WCC27_02835 [Acidobacteriaceae bacterium]
MGRGPILGLENRGGGLEYSDMSNKWREWSGVLLMNLGLLIIGGAVAFAASPSTEGDVENMAKHALDAARVSAFDGSMTYVGQEAIAKPVGGADHEILYTIAGPGQGVKSSVEFRIYSSPAAATAHANPDRKQQMEEAQEFELPRGQFRAYHSNLSGSDLAKDVPQTFHCMALDGKGSWSRCYYYAGGDSNVVVVGTTSSAAANEAILITAMGAQGLGAAKP